MTRLYQKTKSYSLYVIEVSQYNNGYPVDNPIAKKYSLLFENIYL